MAGLFLPYKVVPMVFVGFPILFLLLMLFLPESPIFLMMNDKAEVKKKTISIHFSSSKKHKLRATIEFQEAEKSLRFYRNTRQSEDDRYFSEQLDLLHNKSISKCSEYVIPHSWEISECEVEVDCGYF